jgi:hypothetical protein
MFVTRATGQNFAGILEREGIVCMILSTSVGRTCASSRWPQTVVPSDLPKTARCDEAAHGGAERSRTAAHGAQLPVLKAPRNGKCCSEADLGKVDRPDLRRIGETATLARVASEEAAQEGSVRPR